MFVKIFGQIAVLALVAGCFWGPTLFANPIDDSIYHGYKAGWFPSVKTPCRKVCASAHGARAEGEVFGIASIKNRATYVCKAALTTSGAYAGKGTLYGNNFSSSGRNRLCMVSTADGRVIRKMKFHCLCVFK